MNIFQRDINDEQEPKSSPQITDLASECSSDSDNASENEAFLPTSLRRRTRSRWMSRSKAPWLLTMIFLCLNLLLLALLLFPRQKRVSATDSCHCTDDGYRFAYDYGELSTFFLAHWKNLYDLSLFTYTSDANSIMSTRASVVPCNNKRKISFVGAWRSKSLHITSQ